MKRNRRIVQVAFLLLVCAGVFVLRGEAERWCPFGGVEAVYTYAREGSMLCSLGVSNFYILAAVLGSVVLLRRAFCSYVCPVGTIGELCGDGGGCMGVKPRRLPAVVDRVLSGTKYLVLAIILYFTWRTAELVFRGFDPCYALISRHGEDITTWAYVVSGAVVIGSALVKVPFCRWLCPLAAVFRPFSRIGITRIRRDAEHCVGCEKCSEACPMEIPVGELEEVRASRCTSCMTCIDACVPEGEKPLSWGPAGSTRRVWSQGTLVLLLLGLLTSGVLAAHVRPIPSFVQQRGDGPEAPALVELEIRNLTCRGRGTLLWYFLERDDVFAVDGYLRLEAWPGAGAARARVRYDPASSDESSIKQAITEPYFDVVGNHWRPSPFEIEGYDPFGLFEEDDTSPPGQDSEG